MKVAIIGTGISGLVAARQLAVEHDITVYEANDYIGGHTNTVRVESHGRAYDVDTGFIVFNERTYPNFVQLLHDLRVESVPTRMSFSVKCERTGLEYSSRAVFAQKRNLVRPRFYRMLTDLVRFHREAKDLLEADGDELELGSYLRRGGYSTEFVDKHIIPMGAAIWSTDPSDMLRFPARYFIRFFDNHGLLSLTDQPTWRVVAGGSKQYIAPLTRTYADRIRRRTPVRWIRRYPDRVVVAAGNAEPERYDRVVLATHSDQALRLLADPTDREREILTALVYQENEVLLHTDAGVLPRRRQAWAAWNYHLLDRPGPVAVTYNMNILQGLDAPEQFCVTLNRPDAVDPARVLRHLRYDHPLYTPAALTAQGRRDEISGGRRTYYCGAYWGAGFHEDGVVSALAAVARFGGQPEAPPASNERYEPAALVPPTHAVLSEATV